MKIASRGGSLLITEAFSGVLFETEEGEQLGVCMRDGAYEISVMKRGEDPRWYRVSSMGIEEMGLSVDKPQSIEDRSAAYDTSLAPNTLSKIIN